MAYKTLRRGISYNLAANILETNHYGVVSTKASQKTGWTGFFNKSGLLVARYHEGSGRLQVVTN